MCRTHPAAVSVADGRCCVFLSPTDIPTPSVRQRNPCEQASGDPELAQWLRLHGADKDAIERVGLFT